MQETVVKNLDKDTVITLLMEHWDEFTGLMAGEYETIGCFPAWFYEFTHRLSECMTLCAAEEPSLQATFAHLKGLLEKACIVYDEKLKKFNDHRSIGVEDGLFVVQPHQRSSTLDSGFQNLVDSVL